MATFTRIINKRVGSVSSVDTYSMRGSFTPDEALRALSKIDREEVVHHPVNVNVVYPNEFLRRFECAPDERTHINCRSTVAYGDAGDVGSIMKAREALRQAVRDGRPYATRQQLRQRINTLLRARTRKAKAKARGKK